MPKPKNKNGNNNGAGQGGNNDDEDEDGGGELSDEQRNEIISLVNATVGTQLSRKLPHAITAALEAGLKPIQDQLTNMGGRREGDDDEGDDDQDQQPRGKNKGKGAARGKDPEVEQMRKQLADMKRERDQEREQTRNSKRDSMLREQLEAAGVDKNRIRGAVAVLRDSMKYDDKAGEWVYKTKRDGVDEDLDVETGVAEWAATDEGKSYLAPPTQQQQVRGGSGVRPSNGNGQARVQNGGRPTQDPKAAKAQAKQEALKSLSSAIDSLGGGNIPLG